MASPLTSCDAHIAAAASSPSLPPSSRRSISASGFGTHPPRLTCPCLAPGPRPLLIAAITIANMTPAQLLRLLLRVYESDMTAEMSKASSTRCPLFRRLAAATLLTHPPPRQLLLLLLLFVGTMPWKSRWRMV